MNDDRERRTQLGRGVLVALGSDPVPVGLLAAGLGLTDGLLHMLALPLHYQAGALERGGSNGLAELTMQRAIRIMARHPDCGELLERLEDVDAPPWDAPREALVAEREADLCRLR